MDTQCLAWLTTSPPDAAIPPPNKQQVVAMCLPIHPCHFGEIQLQGLKSQVHFSFEFAGNKIREKKKQSEKVKGTVQKNGTARSAGWGAAALCTGEAFWNVNFSVCIPTVSSVLCTMQGTGMKSARWRNSRSSEKLHTELQAWRLAHCYTRGCKQMHCMFHLLVSWQLIQVHKPPQMLRKFIKIFLPENKREEK